jgi:hypothetical protein
MRPQMISDIFFVSLTTVFTPHSPIQLLIPTAQLLEQHRQLREQRQQGQQLQPQQALLQKLQQQQASLSLNQASALSDNSLDNLQLSRIQSQPTQFQGHVGNQIDNDTPHLQDLDDSLSGNQEPLQQAWIERR